MYLAYTGSAGTAPKKGSKKVLEDLQVHYEYEAFTLGCVQ